MKKIIAFCGIAFAALAVHAATIQTATKDWVRGIFRQQGIYVSGATASTNANGTVTLMSAFSSEAHPDAAFIKLTVVPPGVQVMQMRAARMLKAAPPNAADDDPTLSITIKSGAWIDKRGNEWAFDFGPDGYTWTYPDELPEKPDATHVCDINAECVCKDTLKTRAEHRADAKEEFPMPDTKDIVNPETWFNFDEWPEELINRNLNGEAICHYVEDEQGLMFAIEDIIEKTDAYKDAVMIVANKIINWYDDILVRYCNAHTCPKENPQHEWEEKTCGSTWKVCTRNPAHKEGTESHVIKTYDDVAHYCACGSGAARHAIVGGKKTINAAKTGWTQELSCAVRGCGWKGTVTHVCKHDFCMPCSAGDGCTLKCPTCDGKHQYSGASKSKCSRCRCYGCGAVEIKLAQGENPVTDRDKHGGWNACDEGNHEDPENERSTHGLHCLCECGYNSCRTVAGHYDLTTKLWFNIEAETTHRRTDLPEPNYEQLTEDGVTSKTQHWVADKSECAYCHDPYGKKEDHTFQEEDTPHYKYLNNEKCALRIWCKKCDFKQYQEEEEAGGHSPDNTIPVTYKQGDAGECVKWITCSRCKDQYFEVTEHERDASNECKCANGCGYQFDHEMAEEEDACGNKACVHCGHTDQEATHKGFSENGTVHVCACGKVSEGHEYGPWREVSRTTFEIIYERVCVKDSSGGAGCGAREEKRNSMDGPAFMCDEENHVALSDACGCACGYYNKTEVDETGSFHNWDESVKDNWGNVTCTCRCGSFHRVRIPTTYQKNSGAACDGLCAYCDAKADNGLNVPDAPDESHTPRTGGHCGCLGGHLTADGTNVAKFHIRKPGTCQCLGADGTGGKWHFREPSDGCPSVCAFSNCFGGEHLVAMAEAEDIAPDPAFPVNHTRKNTACGCKCGRYGHANWTEWTGTAKLHYSIPAHCGCECEHATEGQLADFHKKADERDCECECRAKILSHVRADGDCFCTCGRTHANVCPDGLCPNVCHGANHGADTEHGFAADDPDGITNHTPKENGCGCECDAFDSSKFKLEKFHHIPEGQCRCDCYEWHRPVKGECVNVCAKCGDRAVSGFVRDIAPNGIACGSEAHTFLKDAPYCGCKCGAYIVNEEDGKGHRYASESDCECFGHNVLEEDHTAHTRHDLEFVRTQTDKTDSTVCPYCSNEINRYWDLYRCKRCGEEIERTRTEAHGCNKNENKCVCGCKESECRCAACVDGKGTCERCGKKCGLSGSGGSETDEGGNETGGLEGVWGI